jgi:ferredoxin-NADP reductase
VIYRNDLDHLASDNSVDIALTLTRSWPDGWAGHRGRVDKRLLHELGWAADKRPLTYVCGPTGLVEAVANDLVELGHDPSRIRTERFGPTGR